VSRGVGIVEAEGVPVGDLVTSGLAGIATGGAEAWWWVLKLPVAASAPIVAAAAVEDAARVRARRARRDRFITWDRTSEVPLGCTSFG
jgi:hypothetical protein